MSNDPVLWLDTSQEDDMYSEIPRGVPHRVDISSVVVLERDDLFPVNTGDIIEFAFGADALSLDTDGTTLVWIRYYNSDLSHGWRVDRLKETLEGLGVFVERTRKL